MNKALTKILKCATVCVVLLIAGTQSVAAQIDAQFTQYWAVPTYNNPAAVGRTDFVDIHAISRLQWLGIEGAPNTISALADSPFKLLDKRFGAGIVFHQEKLGLYNTLNAGAQISYNQIKFLKGTLSVGAQVGFVSETFKGSEVELPSGDDYHNGTDEAIPTNDLTGNALDLNFGLFYNHKWFWLGISGAHLTAPTISLSQEGSMDETYEFKVGRTFYLMGGSNIPIKNSLIELQPSFLLKKDSNFFTGEFTARAVWKKFLNGGVAYRWNDAVAVMIGAEYKNFTLGYSYDYPISKIAKASSGSHELFLGYKLKLDLRDKNKNKHKSIRIM